MSGSVLSRGGFEGECDAAPGVEEGCGAREVQYDAADGADDVDAQLQEPVAEPRHLGAGARGACGAPAKLLHEHVGGGGQQDAELVRGEPAATGAVEVGWVHMPVDESGSFGLVGIKGRRKK